MNTIKSVLFPVMLLFCTFRAAAVPAYPYPVTITQPDGTQLTVVMKGDEYHHYHTTADGYLIVKNETGVFNYARRDARGILTDTRVKATNKGVRSASERAFISNLSTNTNLTDMSGQMRANRMKQKAASVAPPARFPISGSPRSLVILVNFSDLAYVTANPTDAFTAMLNEEGYDANGGTGSARDYFRDNSMGTFTPQFDVVGPFDLPNNYKYYGENDANGDDKNAVQMIVDACAKADSAGVDFSIYDTDGDGLVDNVFVYYAGHNEAEWASENTVWPHRWSIYRGFNYSGSEASITFDGKRIMDYACTSELKWDEGTSMAGIGTFTHEFGHVLGLADMYATDGATHQTLSYWNIMDAGAYLNEGRTPPAYNAFERFQLGFLTPELLQNNSVNVSLDTLLSSNKAYLISSTETHNLNFNDPTPAEFFLLENRQNKGWDKFLPGHGMLLYRIFYNETDWYNNEPNNDPDAMGVDILEADVIASDATLAGDPFPGTSGVTSFDLISRAGTPFNKEIRGVAENNGKITFSILTPLGIPVVPTDASTITVNGTGFNAAWNAVDRANSYLVDVYTKTEGGGIQTILSENFVKFTKGQPNGSPYGTDISSNLDNYTQMTGWTGTKVFQAGGSAKMGSSDKLGYLVTPALNLSADGGNFTLQFDATAWKGDDKSLKIFVNGQQVHTVTDLDNSAYTFKTYTLPLTGGNASTVIRFEGNKASKGRFILDNVLVTQGTGGVKIPVLNSPFSTTETSYQVSNLESAKSYYYSVRAVNEWQTSALSGEVGPISLVTTGTEKIHSDRLHVWVNDRALCFYSSEGENVEVFNLSGQKMLISKTSEGLNILPVQISGVLIVKVGNRVGKVIVP